MIFFWGGELGKSDGHLTSLKRIPFFNDDKGKEGWRTV